MIGHVEKMSAIIADLEEQAGGEQHRCANCGRTDRSTHRSARGQKRWDTRGSFNLRDRIWISLAPLPPRTAVDTADGLSFIPGNQRCCDRSYREAVDDHGPAGGGGRRRAVPVSAVRQFRAEGERPLKVPSPPAPTAVFTGVGGRALD